MRMNRTMHFTIWRQKRKTNGCTVRYVVVSLMPSYVYSHYVLYAMVDCNAANEEIAR